MKKALIASDELVKHFKDESLLGYRIVEVADKELWEAAPNHFWIDVDDNFDMVSASENYYDSSTKQIMAIPINLELLKKTESLQINQDQPTTTGTQTI